MTEEDIRNYLILKILENSFSRLLLTEANKRFCFNVTVPSIFVTSSNLLVVKIGETENTAIHINDIITSDEVYAYMLNVVSVSIGLEELLEYKILLEM